MKNKKRYFKCIRDYIEDDVRYWTEGRLYEFHKHKYGKYNYFYNVKTNLGTWGGVGIGYMLGEDEIPEYFEVVWRSEDEIQECFEWTR